MTATARLTRNWGSWEIEIDGVADVKNADQNRRLVVIGDIYLSLDGAAAEATRAFLAELPGVPMHKSRNAPMPKVDPRTWMSLIDPLVAEIEEARRVRAAQPEVVSRRHL